MARAIMDDELWRVMEAALPEPKRRRRRYPGRKPLDRRKVMTGILFVLKTGIPWEHLPKEMGCGSGMTCWRYLKRWHHAGVFRKSTASC
jgi:transposase